MTTRELNESDLQTIADLLLNFKLGCGAPAPAVAVKMVERWLGAYLLLGTFDDDGSLYSLRVLERESETTIRMILASHRDSDWFSPKMRRSVLGFVAWLRAVGADTVTHRHVGGEGREHITLGDWKRPMAYARSSIRHDGVIVQAVDKLEEAARGLT